MGEISDLMAISNEYDNTMRVSIVMPCYNGARYLRQAVDSVKRQTHTNWELLIIDNNSSDGSHEIIQAMVGEDHRICSLHCTEPGAANARNAGISKARGRYIAFLDCDDLWLPEKLQRQIQVMQASGAAFCWTSYAVVDSVGQHLRVQLADASIDYESFMTKRNVVGCLTVIYDAELLGKLYMPSIRMRQDYALWAKIIRSAGERNLPLVGLSEMLASFRVHNAAMTRNKVKAAFYQWRLYRNVENLTLSISLRYFWHYLIRAVVDRSKTNSPGKN